MKVKYTYQELEQKLLENAMTSVSKLLCNNKIINGKFNQKQIFNDVKNVLDRAELFEFDNRNSRNSSLGETHIIGKLKVSVPGLKDYQVRGFDYDTIKQSIYHELIHLFIAANQKKIHCMFILLIITN